MGKNTRGIKEISREKILSNENKKLKQQIRFLRKQLAKFDNNVYGDQSVSSEEMVRFEVTPETSNSEDLKKIWKCKKCENGHMEIILYNKIETEWYFRKCNNCDNRTKSQRYNSDVKGILKNS